MCFIVSLNHGYTMNKSMAIHHYLDVIKNNVVGAHSLQVKWMRKMMWGRGAADEGLRPEQRRQHGLWEANASDRGRYRERVVASSISMAWLATGELRDYHQSERSSRSDILAAAARGPPLPVAAGTQVRVATT
jgi:hypothetical protein